MSLESLLSEDSCDFQTQTVVQDASGGPTRPAWTTTYAAVPCRVLDPSAAEVQRFLALGTVALHTILHQQAGVGEGMRAVTSDGRTIKVQGTRKVRGSPLGTIATYFESYGVEWRPGV
jgi:hypothetical protein